MAKNTKLESAFYPLSVAPEEFYSKLGEKEGAMTKKIVETIDTYMSRLGRGPFTVAGVGGVLRYDSPKFAEDIDLAVSGFKYTPGIPGNNRSHSFHDVESFTESVSDYFKMLQGALTSSGVQKEEVGFGWGSGRLHRGGSGPFSGLDQRHGLNLDGRCIGTIESDIESFGWYHSKGLQVRFEGMRPIDVQFIFNKTPGEWEADQYVLQEVPTKTGRKGITDKFPYAILVRK